MATKKTSIKKVVAKKPAIKKPIVKKAVAKKPIVSKMKTGGKIKKAQTGITTSTSYDPQTKETTVKKSWSNTRSGSLGSGSSATPARNINATSKPVPKTISKPVAARPTTSRTPISATTRGERIMTSFPSPTPAKAVGMDLVGNKDIAKMVPKKEKTTEQIRREINRFSNEIARKDAYNELKERVSKQYPDKTPEKAMDKYYRIKDRQERKSEREYNRDQRRNLPSPNKRGSGGCRTC